MQLLKKDIICLNCNKNGHTLKQCYHPISSYGIIAFKIVNKKLFFLMIRRKDTFHYVEFLRGRYILDQKDYINKLFLGMTEEEIQKIKKCNFQELWEDLWMNKNQQKFNYEYHSAKKKFEKLKETPNLLQILEQIKVLWNEPEWGFPKGRRNIGEEDLTCAKREFEEESGITSGNYHIVFNNIYKEVFLGSNNLRYKHIYYIAKCNEETKAILDINNYEQVSEVSDIQWLNINDCLEKIRPYDKSKLKILNDLYNQIKNEEKFKDLILG